MTNEQYRELWLSLQRTLVNMRDRNVDDETNKIARTFLQMMDIVEESIEVEK